MRQLHGQTSADMISKRVHYSLLTKTGPTEHGGVHLVMSESEWDKHGMQSLGPQRWKNGVQDVDLHKCISLLESKVQVPLTTAYEDVATDDEHSDSDVEDQHVDYQEYHTSVHSITATNRQQ
jgi:hypothetical protein